MTAVKDSAENIYNKTLLILRDTHPFAFSTFLLLFIALVFMCLGFLLSNLFFCCVIRTQERKFKVLSNVSWCSSSLSLIMIFISGLALAFSGPVLSDFCRIQ